MLGREIFKSKLLHLEKRPDDLQRYFSRDNFKFDEQCWKNFKASSEIANVRIANVPLMNQKKFFTKKMLKKSTNQKAGNKKVQI